MMLRTALLCSVLYCSTSLAHSTPADWTGVWTATLGSTQLVVCNNGNGTGAYYDPASPRLLTLQRVDEQWQELDSGVHWRVESTPPAGVTIRRADPDGGIVDELSLQPRPGSSGLAPCASGAFVSGLAVTPGPLVSKELSFEDRRFVSVATRMLADITLGAETVQLPAETPVISLLNQQWRTALPHDEQQWAPWRSCLQSSLGLRGDSGVYQERSSISFWTRPWLALQTGLKTRCGNEAESASWGYRLWNLSSGKEVDAWTWFGMREAFPLHRQQRGWARLTPALQRVVLRDWPEEEECRGSDPWYAVRPGVLGLVFERVGVAAACSDEAEVPWSRLQPLLNPAGKLAIQSLMNSVQQ